jgi:hypothetical protein
MLLIRYLCLFKNVIKNKIMSRFCYFYLFIFIIKYKIATNCPYAILEYYQSAQQLTLK